MKRNDCAVCTLKDSPDFRMTTAYTSVSVSPVESQSWAIVVILKHTDEGTPVGTGSEARMRQCVLLFAGLAQLVVQLTCNEKVGSSSLSSGTTIIPRGPQGVAADC